MTGLSGAVPAPVVVVGDVMLDVDRSGTCLRLSPEAPVPVITALTTRRRPGGAALAALLAARDGRRPVALIAPFADDEAAEYIRHMLKGRVEVVPLSFTGSTSVKTRIRIGDHPVARLDEGGTPGNISHIPDRAMELVASAAAILVADYGRGVTAEPGIRTMLSRAAHSTPVVWDPHPAGSPAVEGTALLTPNRAELQVLVPDCPVTQAPDASPAHVLAATRRAARELGRRWGAGAVAVTLGSAGAMLCLGEEPPFMEAGRSVNGTDTCGAGDSFAAAAVLALADGRVLSEALCEAVARANTFVAEGGAAAVRTDEGQDANRPMGRLPWVENPMRAVEAVRERGGTVVATGGCFDLLHAGHIATLEAARALGDCLVVCVNSDASVRRLKGARRPLQCQDDRALMLKALACVDAVIMFDEDTPEQVIRRIRPAVWAKGGDYADMLMPETAVLREWGGQAVTVPYLRGRSTSELIEKAGT